MVVEIFSWIIIVLILVASGVMLTGRDWRYQLAALGMQYIGVFWLVTRHQPFAVGAAKLVTGWMVVAALGMTRLSLPDSEEEDQPSFALNNRPFAIVLTAIIAVITAGATPRIEEAVPGLGLPVIAGGLLLIGSGFIHLGITSDILRVILGLLSLLAGFDILYSAIENSILVTGLLALTNLGLGLIGSYLLIAGRDSPTSSVEEILE